MFYSTLDYVVVYHRIHDGRPQARVLPPRVLELQEEVLKEDQNECRVGSTAGANRSTAFVATCRVSVPFQHEMHAKPSCPQGLR